MLIQFKFANFCAFKDMQAIDALASESDDKHSVIEKDGYRITPLILIHGRNATGKSSIYKALTYFRDFVLHNRQSIIRDKTFWDNINSVKPTYLDIQFIIGKTQYKFGCILKDGAVKNEWLIRYDDLGGRSIYRRNKYKIQSDFNIDQDDLTHAIFKITRHNELLLTRLAENEIDIAMPAYHWFESVLNPINNMDFAYSIQPFIDPTSNLFDDLNSIIQTLNIGHFTIEPRNANLDDLNAPKNLIYRLNKTLREGDSVRLTFEPFNGRYVISKRHDELCADRLIVCRHLGNGQELIIDFDQLSDGGQLITQWVSLMIDEAHPLSPKIYVIDNFGERLHPLMARELLKNYLSGRLPSSRTQLILLTHNTLLLDKELLRHDEIWKTCRAEDEACEVSRLKTLDLK